MARYNRLKGLVQMNKGPSLLNALIELCSVIIAWFQVLTIILEKYSLVYPAAIIMFMITGLHVLINTKTKESFSAIMSLAILICVGCILYPHIRGIGG